MDIVEESLRVLGCTNSSLVLLVRTKADLGLPDVCVAKMYTPKYWNMYCNELRANSLDDCPERVFLMFHSHSEGAARAVAMSTPAIVDASEQYKADPTAETAARLYPLVLAMRWYPLGDVYRAIRTVVPRSMSALIWRVLRDVSVALSDLHRMSVVHCDVKPTNLLLRCASGTHGTHRAHAAQCGECARFVLCDYGLASAVGSHFNNGTHFYTAPEVWKSGEVHPSRDVWALGATVLCLYYGMPAWGAKPTAMPSPDFYCADLKRLLASMLDEAPAARPSPEHIAREAEAHIGA